MFLPEIWGEILIQLNPKDVYYTLIILSLKSKSENIHIDIKKISHSYFLSMLKQNVVLKKYMEIYHNLDKIKSKAKYIQEYTNYYNYISFQLSNCYRFDYVISKANLYMNIILEKNNNIKIKNLILKDSENSFQIENVSLNDKFQLNDFKKIKVKTKDNNKVNNDFIIENKKSIKIKGSIFDASILLEEIDSNENKNNFLKKITKNIEIDFNKVMTSTDIPLNDFRLVGLIKKGSLEKISAKSEFSKDRFLDISLKKEKKTNSSVLEIYSDEAKPLVNGYEFFEGLEGGNLFFTSKTNKNKNSSNLEIENFKLNQAPGFAKLLSLADLRGLTDALKGEGISFDKLSIVYQIENGWMDIKEIFLIGPSISILVEGYFDKRKNILSLRGTLIPAKTLNSLVSKIPILGDILIGKKTGDGLFGISFKIKGPTNNLKTTVNPVKTLTPRFITRTLEEYKKK